jgi:beta-galactosidase
MSGTVDVPNVTLNECQSKILVTDYKFGNHTLPCPSADILVYGVFDVDVLVLYLEQGKVGEFAFKNTPSGLTYKAYRPSSFTTITSNGIQKFVYTKGAGQTTVKFSDRTLVYLLDIPTAWQFWVPPTTANPAVLLNQQIFILSPYLVWSSYISNRVVYVYGDSNKNSTTKFYTGDSQIQTSAGMRSALVP